MEVRARGGQKMSKASGEEEAENVWDVEAPRRQKKV